MAWALHHLMCVSYQDAANSSANVTVRIFGGLPLSANAEAGFVHHRIVGGASVSAHMANGTVRFVAVERANASAGSILRVMVSQLAFPVWVTPPAAVVHIDDMTSSVYIQLPSDPATVVVIASIGSVPTSLEVPAAAGTAEEFNWWGRH